PIGEDPSQNPPYGDYFAEKYRPLYERDIPKMREMGINLVRIYSWNSEKDHSDFLDQLYNDGVQPIRILLNLWIDPETDWQSAKSRAVIVDQFVAIAKNVGDHPAVLGYLIGNETNGHHGNGNKVAFWRTINQTAKALKEVAPQHLVSVAITDALDQVNRFESKLPFIDAWSVQVYRGLTLGTFYQDYAATSERPLIITEFGLDAFDAETHAPYPNNGKFVAATVAEMIRVMESNRDVCSGGCLFEFSDEWWKSEGSPSNQDPGGLPNEGYPDGLLNEEWWGVFEVSKSESGIDKLRPRELFLTLKELWGHEDGKSNHAQHTAP
ncbi:MAG: hypothetical protein F6K21_24890, partial [Symploca sp. SIO2D2]|nr:hypothetical protein [Symploca sp. SIO2D2]